MDATTAARKRPATDIAGEEPSSPAAPTSVEEVSDAEVEEFYAILRRMRDASRRLCGAGARPPARAPAWRPSFSWEDFAPAPATPQPPPAAAEAVAARDDADAAAPPPRAGLDLNVEPEPDATSSAPTTAPATPRSARAQA
ncbi:hypothetical protein PR202_gb26552 [Eleusine coracana subsp. coracana]|uniref:Uncharacterized protein n=1 Tax=Eleusine coracana subsp. coracana TaxID=191504 RepID=A0AAV5FRT2_ELECO|nr:hypothetical protein PR202_gb26552 [Eleusine coracana subsp. coracana]